MKNLKRILRIILIIIFVHVSVTISIQRFKCPKMTETELSLSIIQCFILNFKKC